MSRPWKKACGRACAPNLSYIALNASVHTATAGGGDEEGAVAGRQREEIKRLPVHVKASDDSKTT